MKKIGLTFGGGGARGGVHIGAIQALNELGIQANLVTGTSIGALVAALYAAGVSVEKMTEFFNNLNLTTLYVLPGSAPSFTNFTKFEQLFEQVIGRPMFSDLQPSLAVVATDIVSKKEMILDEGDVLSAVQASMAFPILLPPVERDGFILMDGGMVNNVPFDVARARGAGFVIAIGLGNSAPYGTSTPPPENKSLLRRALRATKNRPLYQVMTAVSDIITDRMVYARMAISAPDVLIQPYVGTIGLLDFQELERAISIGYGAIMDAESEIKRKLSIFQASPEEAGQIINKNR
ncbi:MAG: patatin-like phospholipase family protein [Ardenticatenaceae bacterium]|nr:patatin-like phospholipase family protein [Ardenticatenaceae bacterium]